MRPSGIAKTESAATRHSSANDPCPIQNAVTHMIRAPIERSTPSPTAVIVPVASWPDVNGSGGVSGYVPRHMNTSGNPMPAAVTRMRTWPGPGSGGSSSTSCSTSIGSPAPCTCHARIR